MFPDVTKYHWAYDVIKRMFKRDLIAGHGDGKFRPDTVVTRAELCAIVDRQYTGIATMIEQIAPSVVEIQASEGAYAYGRSSLGSGVVLDTEGYIATNMHVIWYGVEGGKIDVRLDSEPDVSYFAEWVAGDMQQDLAIIKIDIPANKLTPATLADKVLWGEEIVCVGHPLNYRNTVSRGCISYKNRPHLSTTYHQTDASINPGNSGGGAFNMCKEIVGLPTWKQVWLDEDMTVPITNIGFLVPVEAIQHMYYGAIMNKVTTPAKAELATGVNTNVILNYIK